MKRFFKLKILAVLLLLLKYNHFFRSKKSVSEENTLIVIAHPDDEIMFFSPFILNIRNAFVLCLSGNKERKNELKRVINLLKFKFLCMNFKDNSDWNDKLICLIIKLICKKHKFSRIVTFDGYGVSGHKNHISCYKAVKLLSKVKFLGSKIYILFLRSVNLFQKYVFFFSKSEMIFTNSFLQYFYAIKIMFCYKSQLVWFIILYLIFSNFMLVNVFDKE